MTNDKKTEQFTSDEIILIVRMFVRDDSLAATFQSLGQYRGELLRLLALGDDNYQTPVPEKQYQWLEDSPFSVDLNKKIIASLKAGERLLASFKSK